MAHLEGRRIVEGQELPLHGLRDLAARVTGIHAPEPGCSVEHLAAIGGGEIHPFGAHEHARGGLELPVRSERHPVGGKVQLVQERRVLAHG